MSLLAAVLAPLLAGVTLVVSPDGPYRSIQEALAAARDGDTLEVRAGTYDGPLVVDRAVTLAGVGGPVVDGHGRGTVLTVRAAGATVRGLTIRSSGRDLDTGDAGVEVRGSRVLVEDNRLEDVLFGISLDDAAGTVVRGNTVVGKPLPIAERGDGIRLWYSPDVLLQGNAVSGTRDCVIWYSAGLRMLDNRIERQRYGLHFMFDDDAEIAGNLLRDNSVGAYLMYSQRVRLRGNVLAGNRGPSGYGLGLKDVDDLVAEGNWLIDNRVGLWSDGSPRSVDASSRFLGNLLALNDVGLSLSPATQRNVFAGNSFEDNLQQVSVPGGGALRGNSWWENGRGNYWSDYRGFDADGDGVGDVAYRAEALLDDWLDRRPELRLFRFGAAADAVAFADRAFPVLRPAPRLVDEAPLLAPPALAPPPFQLPAQPLPLLATAGGLLTLGLGLGALGRGGSPPSASAKDRRTPGRQPTPHGHPTPEHRPTADDHAPAEARQPPEDRATPALDVVGLTRRFGERVAVDGLSFSVAPGEVVALWGPNGAGKTSAMKCILGLLPCQGEVQIGGLDARRHGREARRGVGYAPQEVAFHDDHGVADTVAFYVALRRLAAGPADALLESLGLAAHRRQPIGTLSGGQRQRLALALALLGSPRLLLLDEPTANLDAAGREQVLSLLQLERQRGRAILLASHRLDEVETLADRVLVLDRGRLAFACPPAELAQRLGLRLSLRLQVAGERREDALALLRDWGLAAAARDGCVVGVEVPPRDKVLPIRLLEQAGIRVADFTIEEVVAGHDAVGAAPGDAVAGAHNAAAGPDEAGAAPDEAGAAPDEAAAPDTTAAGAGAEPEGEAACRS